MGGGSGAIFDKGIPGTFKGKYKPRNSGDWVYIMIKFDT